jgi:hypothetical protein
MDNKMISMIDTTKENNYELMSYPITFHKKCFKEWNTRKSVVPRDYTLGETRLLNGLRFEFYRHILDGDWRYDYESFDDHECAICDSCNKRLKRYADDCDCDLCIEDRN